MAYIVLIGITDIILYAIGLPLLVFVFLFRNRYELNKPVVKFRWGLFFSGFRKETYYWECVVAMRKESTVLLAVFGPQMGVAMLAHVALLVFMVQILVQLVGHPYEARHLKLQVLDVTSIVVCWGTMWSGFFFYSPRPPSQKEALVFLTMLVLVVNVLYMVALLYSMCAETCQENEESTVVKMFRRRTTNVKRRDSRDTSAPTVHRRETQHFVNPALGHEIVKIHPETVPGEMKTHTKSKTNTSTEVVLDKASSGDESATMAIPPAAPTSREIRLASLTAMRLSNKNPMKKIKISKATI